MDDLWKIKVRCPYCAEHQALAEARILNSLAFFCIRCEKQIPDLTVVVTNAKSK